jgi:hypothetical protein
MNYLNQRKICINNLPNDTMNLRIGKNFVLKIRRLTRSWKPTLKAGFRIFKVRIFVLTNFSLNFYPTLVKLFWPMESQ